MPESTPPETPSEVQSLPSKDTLHDADVADAPPPFTIAGRGPMDQMIPDVTPNSTPATRRDD